MSTWDGAGGLRLGPSLAVESAWGMAALDFLYRSSTSANMG